MKTLTYKHLVGMGACRCGLRKFKELFGAEMKVTLANAKKLAVWGTGQAEPYQLREVVLGISSNIFLPFIAWYVSELSLHERGYYRQTQRLHALRYKLWKHSITAVRFRDETSRILVAVLRKEKP